MSVSHSGERVIVAVNPGGSVGVDIELVDTTRDPVKTAHAALRPAELEVLLAVPPSARASAFTRYWARKEAVLKYTGHGLTVDLRDIEVSGPDMPAALLAWSGHPDLTTQIGLKDIDLAYAACVAHPVGRSPVVRSAAPVLSSPGD